MGFIFWQLFVWTTCGLCKWRGFVWSFYPHFESFYSGFFSWIVEFVFPQLLITLRTDYVFTFQIDPYKVSTNTLKFCVGDFLFWTMGFIFSPHLQPLAPTMYEFFNEDACIDHSLTLWNFLLEFLSWTLGFVFPSTCNPSYNYVSIF